MAVNWGNLKFIEFANWCPSGHSLCGCRNWERVERERKKWKREWEKEQWMITQAFNGFESWTFFEISHQVESSWSNKVIITFWNDCETSRWNRLREKWTDCNERKRRESLPCQEYRERNKCEIFGRFHSCPETGVEECTVRTWYIQWPKCQWVNCSLWNEAGLQVHDTIVWKRSQCTEVVIVSLVQVQNLQFLPTLVRYIKDSPALCLDGRIHAYAWN